MKEKRPYRVVLYKKNGDDIDWDHELSDGYGIPAIVIDCPIENRYRKIGAIYSGYDEEGEPVKGIPFDDCAECRYFAGFGSGQEIYCRRINNPKEEE